MTEFPCAHGSDHDVPPWFRFSKHDQALVFYKSTIQLGFNYDSTFEYYPLVSRGYHAIALHLINFGWSNTFACHSHSTGSGLSSTENTAYLLLHHPFCLVMLLFDCILLKPLDIKCRGQHQHVCLFQVLIEFIMRNAILAPRWVAMSSTTSFDSPPMQTWSCISCSAFPW